MLHDLVKINEIQLYWNPMRGLEFRPSDEDSMPHNTGTYCEQENTGILKVREIDIVSKVYSFLGAIVHVSCRIDFAY